MLRCYPMQGSIAQTLALTIGGNAFLQGHSIPDFLPNGSAFRFCSAVQFLDANDTSWGEHDGLVAGYPRAWLAYLQRRGCTGLRLRLLGQNRQDVSDRLNVAFVGGGSRWLIEELDAPSPICWEGAWRGWRRPQDAPDGRIWLVRYHRLGEAAPDDGGPADSLELAAARLREALTAILAFAEGNALGFTEYFKRGLDCLSSSAPLAKAYHADFGPPGFLSLPASQILGACQAGWVFGGMGSWNDGAYGPDLAGDGDALSEQLFDTFQAGLVAAANSTAPKAA
jgi:hypothetical protein